jgi:hypothetical protein
MILAIMEMDLSSTGTRSTIKITLSPDEHPHWDMVSWINYLGLS